MPVNRVFDALDLAGCNRRAPSAGWIARSSTHVDHKPSVGNDEGEEGKAILKCFAGCSPEAALSAIWITWADLWPDGLRCPGQTGRPSNGRPKRTLSGRHTGRPAQQSLICDGG